MDIEQRSHAIMFETVSPTVAARVLGYGLRFAHSQAGRSTLIQEINKYIRDLELLAGLAHLYVFGLIRVFRNPKGPTPDVSPSQSPKPSSQLAVQDAEHLLRKTSLTAKELRKLTLLRENNCCVFTGARDRASIDINMLRADPAMRASRMEIAHIVSQYSSDGIEGVMLAARAKDHRCNHRAIWRLEHPHIAFDQLDMWLTPAKTSNGDLIANTYDVNYVFAQQQVPPEVLSRISFGIRPRIEFTPLNVGSEVVPAPHPELIALHAACARIAHMSGASEYREELSRETDAISVMTEPNAANELARSLKALQLHCR